MRAITFILLLSFGLCNSSLAKLAPIPDISSNNADIDILRFGDSLTTCSMASISIRFSFEELPEEFEEQAFDLAGSYYQAAQLAYNVVLKPERANQRIKLKANIFLGKADQMLKKNPNFLNLLFIECLQTYPKPQDLVDYFELNL